MSCLCPLCGCQNRLGCSKAAGSEFLACVKLLHFCAALLSSHLRAGGRNRNSSSSMAGGEEKPGLDPPFQHSLFSSWRLWDPPATGQEASLWCRVQIQGESPRGGRVLRRDVLALLGQDFCWSWGQGSAVLQKELPNAQYSLIFPACLAVPAHLTCAWCCGITWVGDRPWEPHAQLAPRCSIAFDVTVYQGCPEWNTHISLCAASHPMLVYPTERQR